MADKLRYYEPCPTCGGTGEVDWETEAGSHDCPTCVTNPPHGIEVKVFDGIRHVYKGRFEEVEE